MPLLLPSALRSFLSIPCSPVGRGQSAIPQHCRLQSVCKENVSSTTQINSNNEASIPLSSISYEQKSFPEHGVNIVNKDTDIPMTVTSTLSQRNESCSQFQVTNSVQSDYLNPVINPVFSDLKPDDIFSNGSKFESSSPDPGLELNSLLHDLPWRHIDLCPVTEDPHKPTVFQEKFTQDLNYKTITFEQCGLFVDTYINYIEPLPPCNKSANDDSLNRTTSKNIAGSGQMEVSEQLEPDQSGRATNESSSEDSMPPCSMLPWKQVQQTMGCSVSAGDTPMLSTNSYTRNSESVTQSERMDCCASHRADPCHYYPAVAHHFPQLPSHHNLALSSFQQHQPSQTVGCVPSTPRCIYEGDDDELNLRLTRHERVLDWLENHYQFNDEDPENCGSLHVSLSDVPFCCSYHSPFNDSCSTVRPVISDHAIKLS